MGFIVLVNREITNGATNSASDGDTSGDASQATISCHISIYHVFLILPSILFS